ncbi:DNA excision repair protein ERCC-6-like [Rhizophlyctis rosea]|nr:DNA excision repair protein ERCC-6-like [Rhizophlyctis rosea]
MRVKVFHGPAVAIQKDLRVVFEMGGVVLTTYDKIRLNAAALTNKGSHVWDYIILDEGHTIKNPSSKKSIALREIKASHKLLLTGTPIQNNMGELHALFDYVCNGQLLGTKRSFMLNFGNHITKGEARDATDQEKADADTVAKVLRSLIEPYFLRREKKSLQSKPEQNERAASAEDGVDENSEAAATKGGSSAPGIGDLSSKMEVALWVSMCPLQVQLYESFLKRLDLKSILAHKVAPLSALQIMQKICYHPTLLSSNLKDCEGLDLSTVAKSDALPSELASQSAKLLVLLKLLQNLIGGGHRALVFSSSRMMLDIIEMCVRSQGIRFLRIDGTITDRKERQRRINVFNQDPAYGCFLLTTQVGIGITLTGADRVIMYDPSWNPKKDAQAVDRAYRVGQTKDVIVYRLLACGTVEEKIYRNQIRKEYLSRTATDKSSHVRYFKKAELKDMFTLDDPTFSRTQRYLTQQHPLHEGCLETVMGHFDEIAGIDGVAGFSRHDQLYSMADMESWEEDEDASRLAEQFKMNLQNDAPQPPRTGRKKRERRQEQVMEEEGDVFIVEDIPDENQEPVLPRREASSQVVVVDDWKERLDRIGQKLRKFSEKDVISERDEMRADKYLHFVEEICTEAGVKEHSIIRKSVKHISRMDLGQDELLLVQRAQQLDALWKMLENVKKSVGGDGSGMASPARGRKSYVEEVVEVLDVDEEKRNLDEGVEATSDDVIDLVGENDDVEIVAVERSPKGTKEGGQKFDKRPSMGIEHKVIIRRCRCTVASKDMQQYGDLIIQFK